jgi:transposase
MASFLVSAKDLSIRYELADPPKRKGNRTLGADQGLLDIWTLSDGQTTPYSDGHGHSLETIIETLCRRRRGSKRFRQTLAQRANHVNWAIKHLDLSMVDILKVEQVVNIKYKSFKGKKLGYWPSALIRDGLIKLAEEQSVTVKQQPSVYRSQRCSGCGMVRKSNRKGKLYKCKGCGLKIDADLNAAQNHLAVLPPIPDAVRDARLNLKGFLWKPEGFFKLNGEMLTVSRSSKKEIIL